MEIANDSIIYIFCPGNVHSGGPELLHQMASRLLSSGYDARMYYYFATESDPVDPLYKHWHIPVAETLEDEEKNIIILPETAIFLFFLPQQMQRVIWWLSVDHYITMMCKILEDHLLDTISAPMPSFYYFQKDASVSAHLVQSEYARQFLLANNVATDDILYLGDYLNPVFLENSRIITSSFKRDYVAFNPAKGYSFTKKLMDSATDIQWKAIQGMTPQQVEALLAEAKIYIDFGNHPGKDRIPREAAVSKCVVITSKKGSAANEIDVPIPSAYKLEDSEHNIPVIISLIRDILQNYETHNSRFDNYRKRIMEEPSQFRKDVASIFPVKDGAPTRASIISAVTDSAPLLDLLSQKELSLDILFAADDDDAGHVIDTNGKTIPVISYRDLLFLYGEGRIQKIIAYAASDVEYSIFLKTLLSLGIREDDLVFPK